MVASHINWSSFLKDDQILKINYCSHYNILFFLILFQILKEDCLKAIFVRSICEFVNDFVLPEGYFVRLICWIAKMILDNTFIRLNVLVSFQNRMLFSATECYSMPNLHSIFPNLWIADFTGLKT